MIGVVNQPTIGDPSTLTTSVKTPLVAAVNEIDADLTSLAATVAAIGGSSPNLMWDEVNLHTDDKSYWAGLNWFEGTSSVTYQNDGTNPYGGRTLRITSSAVGKGTYLKELGLQPGDIISAGMMCKAASGTYALRLIFRTTGPGATSKGTYTGASHVFAGDTFPLVIDNITIPDDANWVTVAPYSASPSSIDVYGMWLHRGAVAAQYPTPSPYTATYLRFKEWENARQRLMIRNVDASNFHVYQPQLEDETWIKWMFTKLPGTNNWTYYGADMCSDNAGSSAYGAVTFDIGYSIYYQPDGASAQTCGNHHLYDNFTVVNFYDEDGTVVDPTAASAAFLAKRLRIEQKGTLRHNDTSTTDHATISRFIDISTSEIYEHMRLSWLTSNNLVGYWNTGQLLASSANRAYAHNYGGAAMLAADASINAVGATKAYTWYSARTFAFEVECPTAEAIQLRTSTLKLYPRTIQSDVTRNAGDIDHAEWYWRVIYDKQFEKRI